MWCHLTVPSAPSPLQCSLLCHYVVAKCVNFHLARNSTFSTYLWYIQVIWHGQTCNLYEAQHTDGLSTTRRKDQAAHKCPFDGTSEARHKP